MAVTLFENTYALVKLPFEHEPPCFDVSALTGSSGPPVPEPTTLGILSGALIGMTFLARRKRT